MSHKELLRASILYPSRQDNERLPSKGPDSGEVIITTIGLMGGVKLNYLKAMRKYSYYKNCNGIVNRILRMWYGRRFRILGLKLGYSIGEDVFGYGLVLPHYGTIVVGGTNSVGNYATLHTSTCIADGNSIIGDNFDFATGSIISKPVTIGESVSTCANTTITSDIPSNSLVAGSPAKVVRTNYPTWYNRDGDNWIKRVQKCENLKLAY